MGMISWIIFGLVVGAVAKFLIPGPVPGGWIVTIPLGIAGALVGGFVGRAAGLYGPNDAAGLLMSLVGAVVLLGLYKLIPSKMAPKTTPKTTRPKGIHIFISYRREDTGGYAGRIFDRLSQLLGREHVFMDIDSIEPGIDFADAIQQAVSMCDVLLVLIGREWLRNTDARGHRRLDDPEDFVRLEITTALDRNIRIIPVLVEETKMPDAEDLPEPLKRLTRRNALQISNTRWSYDIERIIDIVQRVVPRSPL
jgi:uncharacterized membrane protein YeaQ/YmgE (transglycosylase-associated protein family)